MKPVPQNKLVPILRPIIEARMGEANLQGRSDPDQAMVFVQEAYDERNGSVFVDSLEDPKACLGLIQQRNPLMEKATGVSLFWVRPDIRDTLESRKLILEMLKTIDAYAAMHGHLAILASAWCYRDSQPQIDSLWESQGFELQERVYIKII